MKALCYRCKKAINRPPSAIARYSKVFCSRSCRTKTFNEETSLKNARILGLDIAPDWFKGFEARGFTYLGNGSVQTPFGTKTTLDALEET